MCSMNTPLCTIIKTQNRHEAPKIRKPQRRVQRNKSSPREKAALPVMWNTKVPQWNSPQIRMRLDCTSSHHSEHGQQRRESRATSNIAKKSRQVGHRQRRVRSEERYHWSLPVVTQRRQKKEVAVYQSIKQLKLSKEYQIYVKPASTR